MTGMVWNRRELGNQNRASDYVTRRMRGETAAYCRDLMDLSTSRWSEYEGLFRAEKIGHATDSSVPQFAHDPEYIDLILDADERGFGRIEGGRVVYG